ncbi:MULTISPECIES: hypothetical protein [unclassified Rothia (in: high G+C Gram-positive bacteria)]|nr:MULTISPECIES: hypothetical protein [unclassified Rothia (in: high G+C Gram-positive bacteria)]
MVDQQVYASKVTRVVYMTNEAVEGSDALLQNRDPNWEKYPYY